MKDKKEKHPPGTTFGDWYLANETARGWTVKRVVNLPSGERSNQRDSRKNYERYLEAYTKNELDWQAMNPGADPKPPRALEDYVMRLNGKDPVAERAKAIAQYKLAWINDELLQNFKEEELYSTVSDRSGADALFGYLNRYALHWFVNIKGLKGPIQWKLHEKEWGKYLMNRALDQENLSDRLRIFRDDDSDSHRTPKTRQLSGKVLGKIVYEMNRFVGYLYKKRRSEFEDELPVISPWGDDLLKTYEAEWRLRYPPRPTKYIKAEHWEIICEALDKGWNPPGKKKKVPKKKKGEPDPKPNTTPIKPPPVWGRQVRLAHDHGLRRCETLGLDLMCVRKGHLRITRQVNKIHDKELKGKISYRPLKGREPYRDIPYWFTDAKKTHSLIKTMLEDERGLPHPDTISRDFRKMCAELRDADGKPLPDYWFHDLRRTFITNAVKKAIPVEDLRLAVGHRDQRTTMKFYVMDGRDLEDDLYVPEEDDDAA